MFVGCYRRPLVLSPTSSCGRSSSRSSPSLARPRPPQVVARAPPTSRGGTSHPSPNPSSCPASLVVAVLLPRREAEEAQLTTLPLLHPHPVAILPPLLSSPLPLAPPVVVACAPSPAASQGGVHHDARDPPPPAIVVIRVGGTIAISRQVPIIIAPAIPFPSSIASFVVVASRRAPAPPPRS
jgi:hypothetical protein